MHPLKTSSEGPEELNTADNISWREQLPPVSTYRYMNMSYVSSGVILHEFMRDLTISLAKRMVATPRSTLTRIASTSQGTPRW